MPNTPAIGPWLLCGTCGSKVGRGDLTGLKGWLELQCRQSKCKALTVFAPPKPNYVPDGRGGVMIDSH